MAALRGTLRGSRRDVSTLGTESLRSVLNTWSESVTTEITKAGAGFNIEVRRKRLPDGADEVVYRGVLSP